MKSAARLRFCFVSCSPVAYTFLHYLFRSRTILGEANRVVSSSARALHACDASDSESEAAAVPRREQLQSLRSAPPNNSAIGFGALALLFSPIASASASVPTLRLQSPPKPPAPSIATSGASIAGATSEPRLLLD